MLRRRRALGIVLAAALAGCSSPAPAPAPTPDPSSPEGRRAALTDQVRALHELESGLAAVPAGDAGFDRRIALCERLSDRIGAIWAATRRAAIVEAKKRAVPRDAEPVQELSRREEDRLLVNFTTEGYAELAALSYQLRWGGWREAGSEAVLEHLIGATGVPVVGIRAACDPGALELIGSADCHAKVALQASVLGIERCP